MPRTPHGEYELRAYRQLIATRVWGSWNEHAVESYASDVKTHAEARQDDGWAHLVDGSRWELATPDTGEVVRELTLWAVSHGIIAVAYVSGGDNLREQYVRHYLTYPMLEHIPRRVLPTLQEALVWLESLGVDLSDVPDPPI